MRYRASEKQEIIRPVERSHLPTKRTLDKLGIPRTTFYRWYERYLSGGPETLEDRSPRPSRVWNRIPMPVRGCWVLSQIFVDRQKGRPLGTLMLRGLRTAENQRIRE